MVMAAAVVGGTALAGSAIASKGAKDATKAQINAAEAAAQVGQERANEAGAIRANSVRDAMDAQLQGNDKANAATGAAITGAQQTQIAATDKAADQLITAAQNAQNEYERALQTGNQTQIAATREAAQQAIAARNAATAQFQAGVKSTNKDYWDATKRSQGMVNDATTAANTKLGDMYNTNKAMYQPYMDTGLEANTQLADGIKADGEFNHRFDQNDFTKDGGYNFRLNEGLNTVQNSALARGGLLSGDTLKAVTDYGQGFASNEYDKAYQRYNSDMDDRFTRLSSLADRGMSATGSVATLGTQYARDAAGNLISAGNKNADLEQTAAGWTGNNTMTGVRYGADNTIANGQTQANATTTIGDITAGGQYASGQSRADMINTIGGMNADRTLGLGNINTEAINAAGKNNTNYYDKQAQILSGGTLAIGDAVANGVTGAGAAQVGGLKDVGNAQAAGAAANGQIWNNGLNRAANTFTTFYTMGKGAK